MFIKSAIAMLITVGFAGGAVYYGTNSAAPAGNEVELRAPEKIKSVKIPDSQQAVSPKMGKDKPAEVAIVEPEKPNPVLKPEPSDEPAPVEAFEPGAVEANHPKSVPEPIPEPEQDSGLNLAEIMPLIMKQIEKMTDVETKDQAYYDVVEFSISQKQFNFADAAMQKIDQAVLRDTARSKIAVGLALDGRADDAFEVIDAVETEGLRDAMRLQVIEALIVPGKLAPGMIIQ